MHAMSAVWNSSTACHDRGGGLSRDSPKVVGSQLVGREYFGVKRLRSSGEGLHRSVGPIYLYEGPHACTMTVKWKQFMRQSGMEINTGGTETIHMT